MIRTPSILFWFSLIIVASIALYRTSDRVQDLNRQLNTLDTSIDSEQQSLHVLKAEWAYLSSPARIESSAKKYLALRPTAPKQIVSLDALNGVLPDRNKTVASVTAEAPPMATIKTASFAAPTPSAMVAKILTKVALHKSAAAPITTTASTGHLNDHMKMERTASVQPMRDSIGTMISQLDEHP